jgi:hypothetical protein
MEEATKDVGLNVGDEEDDNVVEEDVKNKGHDIANKRI